MNKVQVDVKNNETKWEGCSKVAAIVVPSPTKEIVIAEERKLKGGRVYDGGQDFTIAPVEDTGWSEHTPAVHKSCKRNSEFHSIEMLPIGGAMDTDPMINNSDGDSMDEMVNNIGECNTMDKGRINAACKTADDTKNETERDTVELAGDKDSTSEGSSNSSDGETCRICACGEDTGEILISAGCNCKGYLEFCHKSCLETWIQAQRSNRCELCRTTFSSVPQPPRYDDDSISFTSSSSSYVTRHSVRGARACFIMAFFILLSMTITSGLLLTRTIKMSSASYAFQPSINSDDHNFVLTISLSIFIVSICCTMFISICWLTWEISNLCYLDGSSERDRRVLQGMAQIIEEEGTANV